MSLVFLCWNNLLLQRSARPFRRSAKVQQNITPGRRLTVRQIKSLGKSPVDPYMHQLFQGAAVFWTPSLSFPSYRSPLPTQPPICFGFQASDQFSLVDFLQYNALAFRGSGTKLLLFWRCKLTIIIFHYPLISTKNVQIQKVNETNSKNIEI